MNLERKAPWHLWVVGALGLLWNGLGAYDYLMARFERRDYLAAYADAGGLRIEEVMAYFDSFPLWASAAWALGVWGSVAGSILLLVRSRHAASAFLLAMIGLAASILYQANNPLPGLSDMMEARIFNALIVLLLLAQWLYARRMRHSAVLR